MQLTDGCFHGDEKSSLQPGARKQFYSQHACKREYASATKKNVSDANCRNQVVLISEASMLKLLTQELP